MSDLRIVSFLPAATEMACALGLTDSVVGVSHECNYPPAMQGKPVVVRCALPLDTMSLQEIDVAVAERIGNGGSLYEVDEILLEELAPTHILWFTPHSIEDIFENLRALGRAIGRLDCAEQLVASSRARLQQVAELTRRAPHRPRVFCLEWIDPYYCCGHWVPEMIGIAGGEDALGCSGTDSVRTTWDKIAAWSPEVLIVSPCGFGVDAAVEQAHRLLQQPGWSDLPAVRDDRVFAVDANAYFARPGPRVVDGTELLAHLMHPERCAWTGPGDAFRHVHINAQMPRVARVKSCSDCGAEVSCGPQPGTTQCWCDTYPPMEPVGDRDCLCPQCLSRATGVRQSSSV